MHSFHVCQQIQIEFRYQSDSSNMKITTWLFFALCIGVVLADTSEDLIDYINLSNANLQCDEYCNGIFIPYEANGDDCDDKTLADFDDQAETPSFTSFCHTFYETTTVSTPYGGSKTEVNTSTVMDNDCFTTLNKH